MQAGQNVLIQSGPEDDDGDALLAIATQTGVPKHMNLGLVQMKDQERMDRYSDPQKHVKSQAFVAFGSHGFVKALTLTVCCVVETYVRQTGTSVLQHLKSVCRERNCLSVGIAVIRPDAAMAFVPLHQVISSF